MSERIRFRLLDVNRDHPWVCCIVDGNVLERQMLPGVKLFLLWCCKFPRPQESKEPYAASCPQHDMILVCWVLVPDLEHLLQDAWCYRKAGLLGDA